jgi:hypothetical protein
LKPVLTQAQRDMLECAGVLKRGACRCGAAKQYGMAFCFACWRHLPDNVRRALYQRIGQGFEVAYRVACEYLDAWPPPTKKQGKEAVCSR